MNKDVIYIEPEDDITDIITKIEKSKEKIVALVPPKKAGVLRSIVNIKLIAKSGSAVEKTIVLVTTDPSIVKLAGATKIPVAKSLQSAPVIPKLSAEEAEEKTSVEDLEEEPSEESPEETVEEKEEESNNNDAEEKANDVNEEDEEEEEEKPKSKTKKVKGSSKTKNKFFAWISEHKKLAILAGIGLLLLIAFLIWAFVIAPAVTLNVGIRTTSNNFSESVTFTNKLDEEKISEGKFFLEQKKLESTEEVAFEATGKKNVGEKATGDVIVYSYFREKGAIPIPAGSQFKINNLSFVSTGEASLNWDGEDVSACGNNGQASAITSGCLISGRVAVSATESGESYNIAASNSGWSTTANVAVYSDKAMTGGTDSVITIVQQSDIDKAKAELTASSEASNKEKLYETLSDDTLAIDSSFEQTTSEAVSSPAVGEEVKEGETPKLKATTTASVYVIDKTKVDEFITEKAKLESEQKIYEIKNPFVENFSKNDGGFTGRLKASYSTGPKITENDVVEIVKGKGLGQANHDLKDIDGVTSVTINSSFPWVNAVPGDPNKITVILEVQE